MSSTNKKGKDTQPFWKKTKQNKTKTLQPGKRKVKEAKRKGAGP
jgi:hypothetical protein